jgi:hypothetical protein
MGHGKWGSRGKGGTGPGGAWDLQDTPPRSFPKHFKNECGGGRKKENQGVKVIKHGKNTETRPNFFSDVMAMETFKESDGHYR